MAYTPDVIDGAIIQTSWGNEVRNRTMQVFATNAERDAQWLTPPNGAHCVTLDTYSIWLRQAGAWVLAPPQAGSQVVAANRGAQDTWPGNNTPTSVMSINVQAKPGRSYALTAMLSMSGTAAATLWVIIRAGAADIQSVPFSYAGGGLVVVPAQVSHTPNVDGLVTYSMWAQLSAGTGTATAQCSMMAVRGG